MKNILVIALFTAGLAVSAQAVTVGASVGYLTDSKDAYFAGRIGHEFKVTNTLAHIGEIEIGYTSDSEGGAKVSLTPLTLNYRAQFTVKDKISGYLGAGAGLARIRFSFPGSGVPILSDKDSATALQGFAGISFKLSDKAHINLGARYLWIDDVKLFGFLPVEVGDDLSLEVGFHVRF